MAEVSGVEEGSDEGTSAVKVAGMGEIVLWCPPLWEQDGKDEGVTRSEQR